MAARFAGRLARSLVLVLYVVPAAAVAQSAGPHMYPPTAQQQAETRARAGSHPNPDEVCPTMVKFMAPLQQEYPKENFGSMQEGKLQTIEIPLFAEANFEPIFGKAYRQMSRDEIQEIFHKYIVPCGNPKWGIVSSLQEAFMGRSSQAPLAHEKLVPALAALHDARVKINTTGRMLESLPNDPASYDTAKAAPATVTEELKLVWPSERVKFHNAVQNAEKKAATPALEAKVQKLLDGPPTLATVQRLHDAPKDFSELFSLVPSDEAKSVQQRLDARSAEIGPKLVEEQRAVMLGFDGTEDGLRKGAAWVGPFEVLYAGQLNIAGAQELANEYYARRAKQLAPREAEIKRRIEAASDQYALEPIVDSAFPLPADKKLDEYARLQTAAGAKLANLQKKAAQEEEAREREEAAREAAYAKAHGGAASGSHGVSASVMSHANLPESAFTAKGLNNEAILTEMFNGEFEKLDFERDDPLFFGLISGYVDGFFEHCARFLPSNKVMMMREVCTASSHWVNAYGNQVSADTCNAWKWEPTGKYADPVLYKTLQDLEAQATKKVLAMALHPQQESDADYEYKWRGVPEADRPKKKDESLADGLYRVSGMSVHNDMGDLIQKNGCASPGLRRFQDNMLLFARGDQPIRRSGTGISQAAIAPPKDGSAYKDGNYTQLLGDFLSDDAKTWAINRLQQGSLSGVEVKTRDSVGRPATIVGMYASTGLNGKANSWVRLEFKDGIPHCLYYQDLPSTCKTPNRQITAKYMSGGYAE